MSIALVKILNIPLLVDKNYAQVGYNILTRRDVLDGLKGDFRKKISKRKAIFSEKSDDYEPSYIERLDNIGVMHITGAISRYGQLGLSSRTRSLAEFMGDFKELELDPNISTIVINMDTPGGEASGIAEFSEYIHQSKKKTICYIDDMGASAGYWIASACDEIVAFKTALIGSIGVVFILSTANKKEKETVEIISNISPKKRLKINSDEGIEEIEVLANDLGYEFVEAVSKYRKKSYDYVLENFGKGSVMISKKALQFGMIDKIQTFDELIAENQNNTKQDVEKNSKKGEFDMTDDELKKIKADAYKEGLNAEKLRMSAIEKLKGGEHDKLIKKMANEGVNIEDIKTALINENNLSHQNLKKSHKSANDELDEKLTQLDDSDGTPPPPKKAITDEEKFGYLSAGEIAVLTMEENNEI